MSAGTCWRCTQPATCQENGFCSIERLDLPVPAGVTDLDAAEWSEADAAAVMRDANDGGDAQDGFIGALGRLTRGRP